MHTHRHSHTHAYTHSQYNTKAFTRSPDVWAQHQRGIQEVIEGEHPEGGPGEAAVVIPAAKQTSE